MSRSRRAPGAQRRLESPAESVDNPPVVAQGRPSGLRTHAWSEPMAVAMANLMVEHIGHAGAETAGLGPVGRIGHRRYGRRETKPARVALPQRSPLA